MMTDHAGGHLGQEFLFLDPLNQFASCCTLEDFVKAFNIEVLFKSKLLFYFIILLLLLAFRELYRLKPI